MHESLGTYLDFALETARMAGEITLRYFLTNMAVDNKSDGTVITIADTEAEELIRERIEKYFPGHSILGEEYGEKLSTDSRHKWIIDPIDGTRSFAHGVPIYSVLIGLEIDGIVEVGVANFPALSEAVYAASGEGCYWNDHPASVSTISDLSQALVLTNDPEACYKYGRGSAWDRIKTAFGNRRGWGDAYGYLLVATGRAELMVDPIMNTWDCGPFPPILREAGGYFGDWQGNTTIYANEAIGTSQLLLPQVLKLIDNKN
jgi:myo-inositol-1(or 4)-monophosphatase